jgi:hypothetical protein
MFSGKDGAMRRNACGACRLLAAAACLGASAAPAWSDVPTAAAVVTTRCLDCHDAGTREGGLSLESLAAEITPETAAVWTKVLHELDTERMPPPDAEQPTRTEREAAILDLEGRLAAVVQTDDARHRTVFRRLNSDEYRNTIEDLLQLDAPGFDPAEGFPEDIRTHGFATNGESLVTSGFLTRKYLEAAEGAIGRAVHFEPRPHVQTWDLRPPFYKTKYSYPMAEARWYARGEKKPQPWQTLLERPGDSPLHGYTPIDDLRDGMPVAGRYRIRIHAEAKFRDADMGLPSRFALAPPGEWTDRKPLRLQLVSGSLRGLDLTNPDNQGTAEYIATHQQQAERELGHWDLPDDESVWLECEAWLDAGEYPRFVFPNGVNSGNYRINHYFHENRFALLDKEALARFEDNVERGGGFTIPMWVETPRIRVMQVAIEGPLEPEWPPRSHLAIFGAEPYRSDRAEEVLHAFATKAWRRPVDKKEIAPLVALVRSAEAAGEPAEAAITRGLTGVLCSPPFLYREEQGPRLNDHELAARLSYFLAVSQPDDRLRQLATEGRFTDPAVRRAEAERLLTSATSDRFIDAFLDGWLALWKLGSMAPDRAKFRAYYDDALEPAMRQETRLVFKQLLATNGPAVALLDADETIMNAGLARLYGIPAESFEAALGKPVEGLSATDLTPDAAGTAPSRSHQQTGFALVSLPDHRRGGLLGQASILTLTANGVDTSPVIRGAWVLENILGTTTPPPPPNVPVIEPDIRGATTIRERLEKHRAVAACATCHALIDPPGFALESFDAIGRWRDAYADSEKKPPVDPSGELSGASFKNVTELKRLLVERPERFARCLVEKLLVMALGRELDVADRPAIRQILARAAPDGYRLQDLIVLCCESELFAWK